MKKVLLLTDVNFWERSSGNRMRIYSLVEYLSPLVQLTVVNTGPAPPDIGIFLNNKFKSEFHILEHTAYLSSTGYGRRLKKLFKNRQFDAIIIEYIHSSYFLNFLEVGDARVMLDAHDIISDRANDFKKFNYAGALYELSKEIEAELFNIYDNVIAICKPDYDKIEAIIGPYKTLLCPHPFIPQRRPVRKKVKNIVFIASAYLPNQDAINFFIQNCWSKITEKHNLNLCIYGSICGSVQSKEHKNILLKGFEPDAGKMYGEADIVINPVRFGAGLKIKNIEALGNSLPLVTTTHGARGLEAGKDTAFLSADEPEDMIAAILSLVENYGNRSDLGNRAYHFVKENFSPKICFSPLFEALN